MNLLRETVVASQSSTLGDNLADLAIDGDIGTCAETTVENATFWVASLGQKVSLHSIFLQTGGTFLCMILSL